MKAFFRYATDFLAMNSPELSGSCMHPEMMNFTSLSYFSRYCNKHLGQSPSAYRLSLQPRNLHRRFPEVAENM